jgi:putative tRNA adenosine deaminase-associated protein
VATVSEEPAVDFAVAVVREEGNWEATALPPHMSTDLAGLIAALRQQATEGSALGLVSVEDDYFVLIRVAGEDVRLLLSDVTAATDSAFAREVVEMLGRQVPDDDETAQPAGDLALVADLGVDAMELGALCDEIDLYPDEVLADIANRLGFGDQFDRAVDGALR